MPRATELMKVVPTPAGVVAFIGWSATALTQAADATDETLFFYDSSGSLLSVAGFAFPGLGAVGQEWKSHDREALLVPRRALYATGSSSSMFSISFLVSLEDGSATAVPTTGLPNSGVGGTEAIRAATTLILHDPTERAWYELSGLTIEDSGASDNSLRMTIRKVNHDATVAAIWSRTVTHATTTSLPFVAPIGDIILVKLQDWGAANIELSLAGTETAVADMSSLGSAGAGLWRSGSVAPADPVIPTASELATTRYANPGDKSLGISAVNLTSGSTTPSWTRRADGTLIGLTGATSSARAADVIDLSGGSFPVSPSSAGITFDAHTVDDWDGFGTPLTFAPTLVWEV